MALGALWVLGLCFRQLYLEVFLVFRVEGFRLSRLRIGRFRALGRTGLTALTFASWWDGGIVLGFGHFTVELGLRV